MALFEVIMPKLGESIIEATITRWLKKEGDNVSEDDAIVEIATDKVDSEIPSPVEGKITKIHFAEGETVPIGTIIALIDMGGDEEAKPPKAEVQPEDPGEEEPAGDSTVIEKADFSNSSRFYSPLVKSIAGKENIRPDELDAVKGTGKEGRVTKRDILQYLEAKKQGKTTVPAKQERAVKQVESPAIHTVQGDEIVEMDRMRKLIADHMVMSKQVSPHVTMFHEVDMSRIVLWRQRIRDEFQKKHGEKLTFTPIFIEAAAKALRNLPLVNSSVDGYKIIKRKNVNIGMATALPGGNLIVPVIRNADQKNLAGLAKDVNDLASRARDSKLEPDEIQGGTFTITNFGQSGNLTGAPIINQPQVAILGVGTIGKKAVVIESEYGDMIAVRHMMILSLAFDHRIVDGALGGEFLKQIAGYLENFDTKRNI
ncbi:MAG: 2-oxo acid dehydrogenase subunit E2 [Bacteroidales bacterium]|nr:2-oxo acid dehydrogenase subunit E2 [Bacteroidales bacterium]